MEEAQAGASAGRRVAGAALLLAASVLLSRLLGFARDVVLAGLIGRNAQTDAYSAGFMLPDLLNHLLAGGALSVAFLPALRAHPQAARHRGRGPLHRHRARHDGRADAARSPRCSSSSPIRSWPGSSRSRPRCTRSPCGSRASCCPRSSASCAAASCARALMADGHFRSQAGGAAPLQPRDHRGRRGAGRRDRRGRLRLGRARRRRGRRPRLGALGGAGPRARSACASRRATRTSTPT